MKLTRVLKKIAIGGVAVGAALATMIGPTQPAQAASTAASTTVAGGPYGCLTVSVSGVHTSMYTFKFTYRSTCTVAVKTQLTVLGNMYTHGLILITTGPYTFGPYSSGIIQGGAGTTTVMSPIAVYFGARNWCKNNTTQVC